MKIQGQLFIYEYEEGKEEEFPQSAFVQKMKRVFEDDGKTIRWVNDPDFSLPTPQKIFEMNDIRWYYYSDQLLRGENDHMFYEIQTQGKFTFGLLDELLHSFKSASE